MYFLFQLQVAVHSKLETDERFLESFKRSIGYVKLLSELDLLKDPSSKSEAGDDDRMSTGDSTSLTEEILDDISTEMQPSCYSIYGDRLSINSCDSANYSYNSGGGTSTNEVGSSGGNIKTSLSSEKLDKKDNEGPFSLPIHSAASSTKTTNTEYDSLMGNTPKSQSTSSSRIKPGHKRY